MYFHCLRKRMFVVVWALSLNDSHYNCIVWEQSYYCDPLGLFFSASSCIWQLLSFFFLLITSTLTAFVILLLAYNECFDILLWLFLQYFGTEFFIIFMWTWISVRPNHIYYEREGGRDGVVVSKNVFLKTKTMYVYIALSRLLLLKHSCPVCLYTRDILLYSYFLCRV